MVFEFPRVFPADDVEARLPDPTAVRELLHGTDTALEQVLERLAGQLRSQPRRLNDAGKYVVSDEAPDHLIERTLQATRMGYARLALRHGSLSCDFHAYHNERHVLEILDGRIECLMATHGVSALPLRHWCALMLFAACHDLRQRETAEFAAGVGANERASIEEAGRILDACGFSRDEDVDLHVALDLMIGGSTFDARKRHDIGGYNAAEWVQSGGALAGKLDQKLDKHRPGWRDDSLLLAGQQLALIASDLDTGNVAEPFARFVHSAGNLCGEREMISGRSLDAAESAAPALEFLTLGQEHYFFEQHRFCSPMGSAAFAARKDANAPLLRLLIACMRERAAEPGAMPDGRRVLAEFSEMASGVGS